MCKYLGKRVTIYFDKNLILFMHHLIPKDPLQTIQTRPTPSANPIVFSLSQDSPSRSENLQLERSWGFWGVTINGMSDIRWYHGGDWLSKLGVPTNIDP